MPESGYSQISESICVLIARYVSAASPVLIN